MGSTESKLPKMEEDSSGNNANTTTTRPSQRRLTEPDVPLAVDDPWWWEVENENLILDQVPNVTADNSESENVLSHDFNTLLKIGENVNLALISNSNSNNHNGDISLESVKTMNKSETECNKTDYSLAVTDKTDSNSSALEAHIALESSLSAREQSLEEFKEELRVKRLTRQSAVQDLRDEITTLRQQLAAEQCLTKRLRNGEDADTTVESMASDEPSQPLESLDGACAIAIVDADDADAMSRGRHANIELANAQLALQMANSENISLRTEVGVVQKQVVTLKEVIACCKQMITIKEEQCTQLKTKINEIETSFGEREMKIMSDNLRAEYERQLGNIRQLRQLYEERQRISAAEHENLQRLMSIKKDELLVEQEKIKNCEERNQTLLKEVETANNELAAQREECNEHKFEKKALKEEMGAVNTLFSQMVMGFNGKNNLDIDRLTTMLEENRTLLNDMATKEASCSEGATLPKLLFELVEQAAVGTRKASRSPTPTTFANEVAEDVNEGEQDNNNSDATLPTADAAVVGEDAEVDDVSIDATTTANLTAANAKKHLRKSAANTKSKMSSYSSSSTQEASDSASVSVSPSAILKCHEREVIGKVTSAQEIIGNLPKVWKVLMELLSHHKIEQVQFEENGAGEDCYKSVETPNGPKAELSVSKTYIKLKDLILEKKSLVKETNRLKTLNCHLDYRLNEQEKRLSAVSLELTKTWHLVGKMQRQHRQLHTQEQILRYQLQQKRRLLTELKDELEYCRRKWAAARAKNDESQEQYNDLRREFARRKLEDANNSAESGYSDSGPASDEEERAAAAVGVANGGGVAGIDNAISVVDAVVVLPGGSSGSNCRAKHLQEMFEHTRKIKRMQSTSPGRAAAAANGDAEIVLRWNSAPPTCGWRGGGDDIDDDDDDDDDDEEMSNVADGTSTNTGAIPKKGMRTSRSKDRGKRLLGGEDGVASSSVGALYDSDKSSGQRVERASRIHKLELQCKSLIQQVLETSDNRERLEVQLCQFQDEIAPVQYAVPLDEFINKKRLERMTRASSAPATGSLTPREEEYTRKRSERLERLEEESRQLMSRIKRTSDRGHYLRCSLDRIRRAPSREGSFESNTEEEVPKVEEPTIKEATEVEVAAEAEAETSEATMENLENECVEESVTNTSPDKIPLTEEEEAYTARRSARLQRLEEESKQLLTKLSRNNQRGSTIGSRLDALHERFGGDDRSPAVAATVPAESEQESEVTVGQIPATVDQRLQDIQQIASNREERLRILEEEGAKLLSRLTNTSERGTQMINRIAVREKNRQERSASNTPAGEENMEAASTSTAKDVSPTADDTPIAAASTLLPTPKNVACTSIVGEELTERVTVTTTPSQIAAKTGAIPKSKPLAQLCAGRPKPSKESTQTQRRPTDGDSETLEEMVKRLSALPFPAEQPTLSVEPQQDQDNLEPKE